MGLDMYLTRKKYIGGNYEHNKVKGIIDLEKNGTKIPIDLSKISYIDEEVLYWRKANAIHKWFVDNIQEGTDDCKDYYVSSKDLKELLEICNEVIEKAILIDGQIQVSESFKDGKWVANYENGKVIKNVEEISKILPTESGFFFGGTEYDEYYLEDIKYTIEKLTEILEEEKELNENRISYHYEYSSSW